MNAGTLTPAPRAPVTAPAGLATLNSPAADSYLPVEAMHRARRRRRSSSGVEPPVFHLPPLAGGLVPA